MIAKRLKELRKMNNITQKELANALEVVQSAVSQWETGINEPTASCIIKICDYFNVCADYLLGRQDYF